MAFNLLNYAGYLGGIAPYVDAATKQARENQQYKTLAMIAAAQQQRQRQLNQAAFGQPPAAPANQTPMPSMLPSLTPGGAPTPAPVNRFGQPAPAQLPVYNQMTQGAQGAGGTGVQQMPDFNPEGSFASTGLSMGFDPSDVGRAMALGSKSDAAQQALLLRYLLGTGKLGIDQQRADAATINAAANSSRVNTLNAQPPKEAPLSNDPTYKALTEDVSTKRQFANTLLMAKGLNSPEYKQAKKDYDAALKAQSEYKKAASSAAPAPSGSDGYKSLADLQAAYQKGEVTPEEAQKIAIKNGWATE